MTNTNPPLNSTVMDKKKAENDLEKLELKISYLLRFGVLISAAFLAISCLTLFTNPGALGQFKLYEAMTLTETVRIASATGDFLKLAGFFGLAVLVSLPVIRVLLTAFLFIRNKEYTLACMAIFVSLVLLLSFFLGIEH